MKKNNFYVCVIIGAILCTLFTSCSESGDMQKTSLSSTVPKQQNLLLVNYGFWHSFDSINNVKEQLKTSQSIKTRGVGDMPTVK